VRSPLVLAVAVLVGVVTGCGDDPDVGAERAAQARAAGLDAGLDEAVADFLALAARGQTATYQATYPGPDDGTEIVVASRPPDRRIDVVADGEVVQSQIVLGGEAFTCPRDPEADEIVACERTDAIVEPLGAFGPDAMASLASSLTDRAEDFSFEIRTSAIAGVEAQCLVTQVLEGRERAELADTGTICVSPEGALLRVAQGEESLEASEYSTNIPDGTFVRPDRDDDN
jgi:hypothetical protein